MAATLRTVEPDGFVVHLRPTVALDDQEFAEVCRRNPDLRFERTAGGDLIIMPPAGGETGRSNFTINEILGGWVRRDGTGIGFDSSTGFRLPNGAIRSPDAAWLERSRWDRLTAAQREKYLPLCPDFVVELCSPADRLAPLLDKMEEYLANGTSLGWLIDRAERRVYVYRKGLPVECLEDPREVRGDPVLPGFVLPLDEILGA